MKTLCARNAGRGTERTQELARIGKLRANWFRNWGAAAAKKKQGSPLKRAIIYETHGDDCIITHDTTRRYERSEPLSLRYHTLIALNGAESVLKSGSFRSPGCILRSLVCSSTHQEQPHARSVCLPSCFAASFRLQPRTPYFAYFRNSTEIPIFPSFLLRQSPKSSYCTLLLTRY